MSDEEFKLPKVTAPDQIQLYEFYNYVNKWEPRILEALEKARRFDEGYKTYFYKDEDDNAVLQIAVDTVNKAEKWDYICESDPEAEWTLRDSLTRNKKAIIVFESHNSFLIKSHDEHTRKLEAIKKWLSEISMTDEDRSEVDKILGVEA